MKEELWNYNASYKTHLLKQSVIFLLYLVYYASCSSISESLPLKYSTSVQLESDLDYAILKQDGTLWTWGDNLTGTLGNGTMKSNSIPTKISNLKDILAVRFHSGCAIAADVKGNIWFWGNSFLWDDPPDHDFSVTTPIVISSLMGVKNIVIGGNQVLLLRNDGSVWRLTLDHYNPTKYVIPEKIHLKDEIEFISGELALTAKGQIIEFPEYEFVGNNWGALNDTLEINDVSSLQNIARSFSIILKKDSTVWAWGLNNSGNLGNGSLDNNPIPSRIINLSSIISISVEGSRCLALQKDGTVWFWGFVYKDSRKGKLVYQNMPRKLPGLTNIKLVHASPEKKCLFLTKNNHYLSVDLYTMNVEIIKMAR